MTPPTVAQALEQIPAAFGGSWDVFIRDWCLNAVLGYEPANVATALSALNRLWPAKVDELLATSARGTSIVAPAIETGSMLAACESVASIHEVLHRLKAGERSAYSELVLVTALLRLGFAASFAPPIDGHVLDAECTAEGRQIFFEVVAPEPSDANISRQSSIGLLSERVLNSIARCRLEIELYDAFCDVDAQAIVDGIRSTPASTWVQVGDKARLRRTVAGHSLPPLFDDSDGTQIIVGGQRDVQGDSASAVIRHESSDARAKRVFNEEYHQFSNAVPNVLVVNVCAVSAGIKDWPVHMSRLLQPGRNRRVGAIAFFDQGVFGPPERIRRRWRVLVNPHAHFAVPESLLAGLESLDESAFYGIPPHKRLSAAV